MKGEKKKIVSPYILNPTDSLDNDIISSEPTDLSYNPFIDCILHDQL